MGIDIAVAIVLVLAFIKGYKDGLIMSVFSVSAYLVGFFAAMHFSFIVANYLTTNFNIPEQWIPIIAFILLFIAVIFIVRFLGKFIEKLLKKVLPTMVNRLFGSALWMFIAVVIFSLLYQVLDSANLFTSELKNSSVTVPYLRDSADFIKENIGEVIPFIKNLYQQIDDYFREMATQV